MKTTICAILIFATVITSCNLFNSSATPELKLIPYKSGAKWGYIDKNGKIIINPQFDYAYNFTEGIACVKSDGKYGYINEDGKYIVNPQFVDATVFSEGLAAVTPKDGHIEFIDKTGKLKFTLAEAKFCSNFKEGLASVEVNGKWGYIDQTGKMIINPQFSSAYCFSEGLAAVQSFGNQDPDSPPSNTDQKWGFIDKKGNIVINYQFEDSDDPRFIDGVASVKQGDKYGFIDKKGKFVINPQFDYASHVSDGFAVIKQGSTYGYIDKSGKIVINPQFEDARDFQNGNAAVKSSEGKWGYIDKEGKYIINPQFEYASKFYNDFAIVYSGKGGTIGKDGKYLANPQFDDFELIFDTPDYIFPNIKSDFFDVNSIMNFIFGNSTKNSFMGFNSNSTFDQISKKYNIDLNEYDDYQAESDSTFEVIEGVSLYNLKFNFSSSLVKERNPIYRTEQQYDYWNGYHNVQVVDHYENVPNGNAMLSYFTFKLLCNNVEKIDEIFTQLKSQASTKYTSNSDVYVGDGLKFSFQKNYSDIEIQVLFTNNSDIGNIPSAADSAKADAIANAIIEGLKKNTN